MRPVNTIKIGLATGTMLGLLHLVWAALVAAGWGKAVLDFILRLHMIGLDYTVGPFALATAAALVGLTAGIGFVMGLVFALIWNALAARAA
jgi:thiamine transporter ThiT